jgi:rhodanese-related sulfurtransferase
LSRWNGIAIAVFSGSAPFYYSDELTRLALFLSFVTGALWFAARYIGSEKGPSSLLALVAAISVSFFSCMFFYPNSFASFSTSRGLAISTGAETIEEIDYGSLIRKMKSRSCQIIDCRYSLDFNDGSLDSAINVPVDISIAKLQKIISGIPKSTELVLFCQSRGCRFSDIIGSELAKQGFRNLKIFRGGYVEWEAGISKE